MLLPIKDQSAQANIVNATTNTLSVSISSNFANNLQSNQDNTASSQLHVQHEAPSTSSQQEITASNSTYASSKSNITNNASTTVSPEIKLLLINTSRYEQPERDQSVNGSTSSVGSAGKTSSLVAGFRRDLNAIPDNSRWADVARFGQKLIPSASRLSKSTILMDQQDEIKPVDQVQKPVRYGSRRKAKSVMDFSESIDSGAMQSSLSDDDWFAQSSSKLKQTATPKSSEVFPRKQSSSRVIKQADAKQPSQVKLGQSASPIAISKIPATSKATDSLTSSATSKKHHHSKPISSAENQHGEQKAQEDEEEQEIDTDDFKAQSRLSKDDEKKGKKKDKKKDNFNEAKFYESFNDFDSNSFSHEEPQSGKNHEKEVKKDEIASIDNKAEEKMDHNHEECEHDVNIKLKYHHHEHEHHHHQIPPPPAPESHHEHHEQQEQHQEHEEKEKGDGGEDEGQDKHGHEEHHEAKAEKEEIKEQHEETVQEEKKPIVAQHEEKKHKKKVHIKEKKEKKQEVKSEIKQEVAELKEKPKKHKKHNKKIVAEPVAHVEKQHEQAEMIKKPEKEHHEAKKAPEVTVVLKQEFKKEEKIINHHNHHQEKKAEKAIEEPKIVEQPAKQPAQKDELDKAHIEVHKHKHFELHQHLNMHQEPEIVTHDQHHEHLGTPIEHHEEIIGHHEPPQQHHHHIHHPQPAEFEVVHPEHLNQHHHEHAPILHDNPHEIPPQFHQGQQHHEQPIWNHQPFQPIIENNHHHQEPVNQNHHWMSHAHNQHPIVIEDHSALHRAGMTYKEEVMDHPHGMGLSPVGVRPLMTAFSAPQPVRKSTHQLLANQNTKIPFNNEKIIQHLQQTKKN